MTVSLSYELIKSALFLSMKAHKRNQHHYITNIKKRGSGSSSSSSSSSSSMEVLIIAFPGPWEVNDLYHDDHFGETDVDHDLFPSLRRIGEDRPAKVNKAFLQRFHDILNNSAFKTEVEKAAMEDKKILLTGHSFGGAIASFSTLWILEKYVRKQGTRFPVSCVTFGSPLIGDKTLSHAVQREKWVRHFTHFVMEHDIAPRMMFAPKMSIQEHLPKILKFFQEKVNPTNHKPHKFLKFLNKTTPERTNDHDQPIDSDQAVALFENVMFYASTAASQSAFELMQPSNSLLEKLSVDYVKVSPYRPFGVYIFCTRDETQGQIRPRQQLVVENPNAVLQLLFYFLQLTSEDQNLADFALNSLTESFRYEEELSKNGLQLQNWVHLKHLNDHLLTPNGTDNDAVHTSNKALFELSESARCCLMAAEEADKRKKENEKQIDMFMREYRTERTRDDQKIIENILDEIQKYKDDHANGIRDYYDAFKLQDDKEDFVANINRLELAKIWDVIVEMLMREDLPDEFEGREKWVDLGTVFRRLVEPLDIANYYRHSKGAGYMKNRPKRYKFTERWYEHANGTGFELISESNFIAEVEELKKEVEETRKKTVEKVKEELKSIEEQVQKWISDKKIPEKDVFRGESTCSMLWKKLSGSSEA